MTGFATGGTGKWPTRRVPPGEPAPERLSRFVADEWPPGDHGPAVEWMNAALAWLAEDPRRRLPVGERGDALDVIRAAAQTLLDAHTGDDND